MREADGLAPAILLPSGIPLLFGLAAGFTCLIFPFTSGNTRLGVDLAALTLLMTAALLRARQLPLGIVSPFPTWIVGGLGYSIPTVLTLMAAGAFTTERTVSEGTIGTGVHAIVVWLAAATIGYGIAALNPRSLRLSPAARNRNAPLAVAAWIAGALGAAAIAVFVFGVVGFSTLRTAAYGERYRLMDGYGVLLAGIQTVIGAALILMAIHYRRRSRGIPPAMVAALLVIGSWTWLIESRSAFTQLLIGLVATRQLLGKPFRTSTLVMGGLLVFSLGLIFALVRGGQDASTQLTGAQLALFNPANGEFGGVAITVGDIIAAVPSSEPYRLGSTITDAVGQLIPRAIWPSRPIAPSQWYVERFYPEFADIGGAYAFSPVAEAYLNFGWVGIIAGAVFVGLMLAYWESLLLNVRNSSLMVTVVHASVLPWLILATRLDFSTVLKTVMVGTLGQLVVLFLAGQLIAWMYGALHTPAAASRGLAK